MTCDEKKNTPQKLYIISRFLSSWLDYGHTSWTPNHFSVINVITRTPFLIMKIVTYICVTDVVRNIVRRNTKNALSSHLRCEVQLSNVKHTFPRSANSVVNNVTLQFVLVVFHQMNTGIILLLTSREHLNLKKNALKGT